MPDLEFDTAEAAQRLDAMEPVEIDALDFGVVTMNRSGRVVHYNAHEVAHTGFAADDVIGATFFETVGPCMNNYLVAQRFADAAADNAALDITLDYVFTLRMDPTPVTLRLLAAPGSERQYLAVRFP